MALGDFVHGKDAQQDPSQQNNNGRIDTKTSRQRAAELARVEVPRTTLNAFGTTSSNTQHGQRQQQPDNAHKAVENHGYEQIVRPGGHDMFDTDLEGIDDSTTVTSLSFEKGDATNGHERRREPPRESIEVQDFAPQPFDLVGNQPRGVSDAYKHMAERVRELDSDPEDPEDVGMNGVQAYGRPGGVDDYGATNEMNGEIAQSYGWNGNYAAESAPLTWQRIEEVLHENRNHRERSAAAPARTALDMGAAYPEQERRPFQPSGIAPEDRDDTAGYRPGSQTPPHPSQTTPAKGRVSVRSRFMTPNFPNERSSGRLGSTKKNPHSLIPRPSSVPAHPPSARSSRGQTVTQATTPVEAVSQSFPPPPQPPSPLEDTNGQQFDQGGGIFDNTDLSALDSPESTDEAVDQHQATTSGSPHLSTVSPASTSPSPSSHHKRPLSPQQSSSAAAATAGGGGPTSRFVSDYAPNILQTKSFADLTSESFDYNPAPPQPIFPPQDPLPSLPERLTRLKSFTDEQRRALFSGLTLAEWEESGDWLIEQFGEILQKTKDARQERRKVAAVFEAEVRRRFEAAEDEGNDVQRRLDEMRTGGMGVLKKQNGP